MGNLNARASSVKSWTVIDRDRFGGESGTGIAKDAR